VYAAFIGISFGIGGLWNIPLQHAFHRDESAAQELTTIMFASIAIMAPICGFIADKTGRHIAILLIGCLLAMYAIYKIVFISERAEFWVVQLEFLILGMGLSTGVLVFAVALRLSDQAHAGTVAGMVNGLGLMGSGLFQLLPGIIQKDSDSSGLPALQEGLLMYLIWPVVALILLIHLAWKEHIIKRNGDIAA
jgi:nitrate/nitrite transporter NarK